MQHFQVRETVDLRRSLFQSTESAALVIHKLLQRRDAGEITTGQVDLELGMFIIGVSTPTIQSVATDSYQFHCSVSFAGHRNIRHDNGNVRADAGHAPNRTSSHSRRNRSIELHHDECHSRRHRPYAVHRNGVEGDATLVPASTVHGSSRRPQHQAGQVYTAPGHYRHHSRSSHTSQGSVVGPRPRPICAGALLARTQPRIRSVLLHAVQSWYTQLHRHQVRDDVDEDFHLPFGDTIRVPHPHAVQ